MIIKKCYNPCAWLLVCQAEILKTIFGPKISIEKCTEKCKLAAKEIHTSGLWCPDLKCLLFVFIVI